MFFVNYLPEFLYQLLKLSNVRPTDFANSKHALFILLDCTENWTSNIGVGYIIPKITVYVEIGYD